MGPPAIVFGDVAAVGTKAVIDDRNDRRREAREERERMERQAREIEQKRIRDEAEKDSLKNNKNGKMKRKDGWKKKLKNKRN